MLLENLSLHAQSLTIQQISKGNKFLTGIFDLNKKRLIHALIFHMQLAFANMKNLTYSLEQAYHL